MKGSHSICFSKQVLHFSGAEKIFLIFDEGLTGLFIRIPNYSIENSPFEMYCE